MKSFTYSFLLLFNTIKFSQPRLSESNETINNVTKISKQQNGKSSTIPSSSKSNYIINTTYSLQNERLEKEKVRVGENGPGIQPYWVMGGKNVTKNEFQRDFRFMCSLVDEVEFKGQVFDSHRCGCTLIAKNVALTAAHCDTKGSKIQLGKVFLNEAQNIQAALPVENFTISKRVSHPKWNESTFSHDVMLVQFDGESSMPLVDLRVSKRTINNAVILTVLGWGVTSDGGREFSNVLQKVSINYMDRNTCRDYYGTSLDNSMLCAYKDGADACQGDSGGPLLRKSTQTNNYVQLGIVSWGIMCGVYPGVYSDLTKFKTFIRDTMCDENGLSPSSCVSGTLPNFV